MLLTQHVPMHVQAEGAHGRLLCVLLLHELLAEQQAAASYRRSYTSCANQNDQLFICAHNLLAHRIDLHTPVPWTCMHDNMLPMVAHSTAGMPMKCIRCYPISNLALRADPSTAVFRPCRHRIELLR